MRSETSSLKLPNQNQNSKGSLISLLLPKKKSCGRKNSDRSSGSRSSRKQLSDFPGRRENYLHKRQRTEIQTPRVFYPRSIPKPSWGARGEISFTTASKKSTSLTETRMCFVTFGIFYYNGEIAFSKRTNVSAILLTKFRFSEFRTNTSARVAGKDEFEPAAEETGENSE